MTSVNGEFLKSYQKLLRFLRSDHKGVIDKNKALHRSINMFMVCVPKDRLTKTYFNSFNAFRCIPITQGSSVYGNVWKLEARNEFTKPENIFMYKDNIESHLFFYLI